LVPICFGSVRIQLPHIFETISLIYSSLCATLTGLPVLLREEQIQTEYPEDIDDENVTEAGFLPTLPGESTRISSALALFSASRV